MAWSTTSDVNEFLAAAGEWLKLRPAHNTVLLSATEALRVSPLDPVGGVVSMMGWWTAADTPAGAFLHTPPHPLEISNLAPGAARALAATLTGISRPITQVSGDRRAVDEFADGWLRANPGTGTAVAMSQRLYRLGDLIDPGTPGKPRVASTADREMLIEWRQGFVAENPGLPSGDLDRAVDRMLTYGGLTLWTVDGSPVSVASRTRPVGGMVRVGSVYTPPELRRRGYAAAVVAHVSRTAREAGSPEVVLFTDLANPTSNSVYQRIGFRAVEDRVVLDLLPQPSLIS